MVNFSAEKWRKNLAKPETWNKLLAEVKEIWIQRNCESSSGKYLDYSREFSPENLDNTVVNWAQIKIHRVKVWQQFFIPPLSTEWAQLDWRKRFGSFVLQPLLPSNKLICKWREIWLRNFSRIFHEVQLFLAQKRKSNNVDGVKRKKTNMAVERMRVRRKLWKENVCMWSENEGKGKVLA